MEESWKWILFVGGASYALLFWSIALRYPAVPITFILGLAPFQNDVSVLPGLHFSLSELHLLLSVPLLYFRRRGVLLGWMGGPLIIALGITFLLTLTHWRGTSGVSLVQMALYWVVVVAVCSSLPRAPEDLELAWKGLLWVGLLISGMAVVSRSSYFLGLHKNGIGASLACCLVVAVDQWLRSKAVMRVVFAGLIGLIGFALILVLSRGAWIAATVGVASLMIWKGRFWSLVKLSFLLIPVIGLSWALLPDESKAYAFGFDPTRYNIKARHLNDEFAKSEWDSSPWLGVGAGLRKEYDATNVFWLTLAETGPLGVGAFFGAHGVVLLGLWRRRSLVKGTPADSAMGVAGALLLGKLVHGMVDHYWSRGAITIAWGSVGLALGMEFWSRRQRGENNVERGSEVLLEHSQRPARMASSVRPPRYFTLKREDG